MIDAELLFYLLLNAGKPDGSTVRPETDLDSISELPLCLFRVGGDGQTSNGPGIWTVSLDLAVIAGSIDAAKPVVAAFYDLVWSWATDPDSAIVDNVGWVAEVSDISLFSLAPQPDVNVRDAAQYDGAFSLELRN